MMPDRFDELKNPNLSQKPKEAAKPKKKQAVKVSHPEVVTLPTSISMEQIQPSLPPSPIAFEPWSHQPPTVPLSLAVPSFGMSGPNYQDIRSDKYGEDYSRGAGKNVYSTPEEYLSRFNAVADLPAMKELAEGGKKSAEARKLFLENYPVQSNLNPLMALADFIAQGGKAQSGYGKGPSSYEDQAKQIQDMLDDEQKTKAAVTQMNLTQAGGLKSGQEEMGTKVGADIGRAQGIKPQRPSSGFMGGVSPASILGAERWLIGENQKLVKSYQDGAESLASVKRAIASGNFGSVKRALGLAARALSGEKGVLTEQDIGRILPTTLGMDLDKIASYLLGDPDIKISPHTLATLEQDIISAESKLVKKYQERFKTLHEQTMQSTVMGNMPSFGNINKAAAPITGEKESQEIIPKKTEMQRFKEAQKAGVK